MSVEHKPQTGTTEVVISECFGGFGFSKAAWDRLRELGVDVKYEHELKDRTDPRLVQVVRELGKEASGGFAELRVVSIPADAEWYIDEYDGYECIREGRVWDSDGVSYPGRERPS